MSHVGYIHVEKRLEADIGFKWTRDNFRQCIYSRTRPLGGLSEILTRMVFHWQGLQQNELNINRRGDVNRPPNEDDGVT